MKQCKAEQGKGSQRSQQLEFTEAKQGKEQQFTEAKPGTSKQIIAKQSKANEVKVHSIPGKAKQRKAEAEQMKL